MQAEEFGFYQDSGDEAGKEASSEEEQKVSGPLINRDNAYIKDDFAQLSSLCSELFNQN